MSLLIWFLIGVLIGIVVLCVGIAFTVRKIEVKHERSPEEEP